MKQFKLILALAVVLSTTGTLAWAKDGSGENGSGGDGGGHGNTGHRPEFNLVPIATLGEGHGSNGRSNPKTIPFEKPNTDRGSQPQEKSTGCGGPKFKS